MIKKRGKKTWLIGLLLLGVTGIAAAVYAKMAKPNNAIDASRLAVVERGDITKSVVATGRIEPIAKVEIKAKANGIIKELKVQVGDFVQAGHVLAELDKENLAARVRETQAALLSAEANRTAAFAQLDKNKVEAEAPDVSFTKRNVDRAESLQKEGVLSKQVTDDTRSAYEQALNKQNIARAQLPVSQAKIAQAEAEVAQATAAVDRAQEELSYATIRSPIAGVVLSRDVEIGSPVSSILNMGAAATLVMTLGDISEVYVKGKVDEADIGVVQMHQPARIKVETFKDKSFEGRVTQISPLGVDKENVITFEVRVSISNHGSLLRANMTANAEIVLEDHKAVLLIPESAILYDDKRNATVEIPAAGKEKGREKKAIKVGISNGTKTEVLSGLNENDQVILH